MVLPTVGPFVTIGLLLTQRAPACPVFHDPIEECLLKANIVANLFALNPFVPEDFFALGEEFLIEGRAMKRIIGIG